jgi:hypothetical protein
MPEISSGFDVTSAEPLDKGRSRVATFSDLASIVGKYPGLKGVYVIDEDMWYRLKADGLTWEAETVGATTTYDSDNKLLVTNTTTGLPEEVPEVTWDPTNKALGIKGLLGGRIDLSDNKGSQISLKQEIKSSWTMTPNNDFKTIRQQIIDAYNVIFLIGEDFSDQGIVGKSIDGGITYTITVIPNMLFIYGIMQDNSNSGTGKYLIVGVGASDHIYISRTINNGDTWSNGVDIGVADLLLHPSGPGIVFYSGNIIFLAGNDQTAVSGTYQSVFVISTDLGVTWDTKPSLGLIAKGGSWYSYNDSGFIFGNNLSTQAIISRTDDYGDTWLDNVFNDLASISNLKFINYFNGFAVGNKDGGGFIKMTTDRGDTWDPAIPITGTNSVEDIFIGQESIIVTGRVYNSTLAAYTGTISTSLDGGYTWSTETLNDLHIIYWAQFLTTPNELLGFGFGKYDSTYYNLKNIRGGARDYNITLLRDGLTTQPVRLTNIDSPFNPTDAVNLKFFKDKLEAEISTIGGTFPDDGKEYVLMGLGTIKSWQLVVDTNGTSITQKTKLQAGAVGDWVNGSYVGATSGVITTTKGGEKFVGQDSTNNNYYLYECIVDNTWVRQQIS